VSAVLVLSFKASHGASLTQSSAGRVCLRLEALNILSNDPLLDFAVESIAATPFLLSLSPALLTVYPAYDTVSLLLARS